MQSENLVDVNSLIEEKQPRKVDVSSLIEPKNQKKNPSQDSQENIYSGQRPSSFPLQNTGFASKVQLGLPENNPNNPLSNNPLWNMPKVDESELTLDLKGGKVPKNVKEYNKAFENVTGYQDFNLKNIPSANEDFFSDKRNSDIEARKYKDYKQAEEGIRNVQQKIHYGAIKPEELRAAMDNPYSNKIIGDAIAPFVDGENVGTGNVDYSKVADKIFQANKQNAVSAQQIALQQEEKDVSGEMSKLFPSLSVDFNSTESISNALQEIKGKYAGAISLKETEKRIPYKDRRMLPSVDGVDGIINKSQPIINVLQKRLMYNQSLLPISNSVKEINDRINHAVISNLNENDENGVDVVTEDPVKQEQVKMGLSYFEKENPGYFKGVFNTLKQTGKMASSDFYTIARTGQEIYNQKVYTGATIEGVDVPRETNFDYTTRDQRKSDIAAIIGEELKKKSGNGLTLFGLVKGLNYSANEIKDAAANAGFDPNSDIVKELITEESLFGYDAIPKSGIANQIIAGGLQVIKPTGNFVSNLINKASGQGETTGERYLRTKSLSNIQSTGQKVTGSDGEVSETLPSERGVSTDIFNGLGQFAAQIVLTKGVGTPLEIGSKGIASLIGKRLGVTAVRGIADYGGTYLSMLGQSYDSSYDQYLQSTGSEAIAKRAGFVDANIQALTELILPDIKIARRGVNGLREGLVSDLQGLVKKGGDVSTLLKESRAPLEKFISGYTSMLATEIGEEEAGALGSYLNRLVFDPKAQVDDSSVLDDAWNVAKSTALSMAIPALFGAVGGAFQKDFTQKSLHHAALNFDDYKTALQSSLDKNYISQDDFNKSVQLLNTHRESLNEVPELKSDGGKLSVEQGLDYALESTKIKYFKDRQQKAKTAPENEMYDAKIKASENVQREILNAPTGSQKSSIQNNAPQPAQTGSRSGNVSVIKPKTQEEIDNQIPTVTIAPKENTPETKQSVSVVLPQTIERGREMPMVTVGGKTNENATEKATEVSQPAEAASTTNEAANKVKQPTEESLVSQAKDLVNSGVVKGFTAETLKESANNNPTEFQQHLKDISEQANDPKSNKATVDTYGKELVDIAQKLNPETKIETKTSPTIENDTSNKNEVGNFEADLSDSNSSLEEKMKSVDNLMSKYGVESKAVKPFIEKAIERANGISVNSVFDIAKRISENDGKPLSIEHIAEALNYEMDRVAKERDAFTISTDDVKDAIFSPHSTYTPANKERKAEIGLVDKSYQERLNLLNEVKGKYENLDSPSKSLVKTFLDRMDEDIREKAKLNTDEYISLVGGIVDGKTTPDVAENISKAITKIDNKEAIELRKQKPIKEPLLNEDNTEQALRRFQSSELSKINVFSRDEVGRMISDMIKKRKEASINLVSADLYNLPEKAKRIALSKDGSVSLYDKDDKKVNHSPISKERFEEIAYKVGNNQRKDAGSISRAYHKAKEDGSNPELVKAVEYLLSPKNDQNTATPTAVSSPISENKTEPQRQGSEGNVSENTRPTKRGNAETSTTVLEGKENPISVKGESSKSILNSNVDLKGGEKEEFMQPAEWKEDAKVGDKVKYIANNGEEHQGNFRGFYKGDKNGQAMIDVVENKDGKKSYSSLNVDVSKVAFDKKLSKGNPDAIEYAIDNGLYQDAIKEGRMTANDAKSIIETVPYLKVPKDILEKANSENKAPKEKPISKPISEVKEKPSKPTNTKESNFSKKLKDKYKDFNLGGTKSAEKADTKIEGGIKTDNGKQPIEQYVSRAKEVLNKLFPDATFESYKTKEEYEKAGGAEGTRGMFITESDGSKRLLLNVEQMKEDGIGKTAFHEAIHPIVDEVVGAHPEELNPLWNDLYREMQGVKGFEKVVEHVELYKQDERPAAEGLTELLTQIAEGNISLDDVPPARKGIIVDLLNKLFEKLGLNIRFGESYDFKDFATDIKKAFETGDVEALKNVVDERVESNKRAKDNAGKVNDLLFGKSADKGRFEAAASKIADSIRNADIPQWIINTSSEAKQSGFGLSGENMKEALAKSIEAVGKIMDKGVDLKEAIAREVDNFIKNIKSFDGIKDLKPTFEKTLRDNFEKEALNQFSKEPSDRAATVENMVKDAMDEGFETLSDIKEAITNGLGIDTPAFRKMIDDAYERVNKGGVPPKEPINSSENSLSDDPPFTLIKSNLEIERERLGMNKYEGSVVSNKRAMEAAIETMNKWKEDGVYNKEIKKVLDDALTGEISDAGQNILAQHIVDLQKTMDNTDRYSKDYDDLLLQKQKAIEAGDVLRSEAGRILGRNMPMRGKIIEKVSDVEMDMMDDSVSDSLTKEQKQQAQERFDAIKKKLDAEQELRQKAEEEIARLKADKKVKKEAAISGKKTREDYIKERTNIRKSIKEKWIAAGKTDENAPTQAGFVNLPFSTRQLMAVAPDVSRLMKSYLHEGTAKTLEEVQKLLKKDLDEEGIVLENGDIRRLIAGDFDTPKKGRNEILEQVSNLKREQRIMNEIENLENGKIEVSPKREKRNNKRLAELRKRLEAVRKLKGVGKYSVESKNEAAEKAAEKNINELEEKIKNNDLAIKKSESLNETERVKELRQKQKQLKNDLENKRKAEKVGKYSDQSRNEAAQKAAKKSIEDLENRIKNNELGIKKSEELNQTERTKELRQKQKDLNEQLDKKRKEAKVGKYSDEQKFTTTLKQRISANEKEQQRLLEKIKNKDYAEEVESPFIIDNKELQAKNKELYDKYVNSLVEKERALVDYEKARIDDKLKNRDFLQKAGHYLSVVVMTSKGTVAMFDQSVFLVQMLPFTFSHPVEALKYARHGLQMFKNKTQFERNIAILHNSKWWNTIEKSGLAVYEPTSAKRELRNELHGGEKNLLNKDIIIGNKNYSVGQAFERSTSTLLNDARIWLFMNRVSRLQDAGKTIENSPKEYEAAARVVNELTGHGKPHQVFQHELVNHFIWSTKMFSSTLNLLGLGDLVRPVATARGIAKNLGIKVKEDANESKGFYTSLTPTQGRFVAKEMVKFIGTGVLIMLITKMLRHDDDDTEVDFNPKSSAFGSIKIGAKTYPIFGRFGSAARTIVQSVIFNQKVYKGKTTELGEKYGSPTAWDVFFKSFVRGKATPLAGTTFDYVLNNKKNFYTKEELSAMKIAQGLAVPLSLGDIPNNFIRDGFLEGVVNSLLGVYGLNAWDDRDFVRKPKKKKTSSPKYTY